jgi:hypothetical protein
MLGDLDAFRVFQAGVPERAEAPPEFASARLIGDFRALSARLPVTAS